MSIHFFSEETSFLLDRQDDYAKWMQKIVASHAYTVDELNYIFTSDEHLLGINQEHLGHDYYTDIITFDNSDEELTISGDVFISVDRVKDNAATLNIPFLDELSRVMAHGLLHLLGFNDKTEDEEKLMREKEDACISLQKG